MFQTLILVADPATLKIPSSLRAGFKIRMYNDKQLVPTLLNYGTHAHLP